MALISSILPHAEPFPLPLSPSPPRSMLIFLCLRRDLKRSKFFTNLSISYFIRSTISIFPHKTQEMKEFRVWNSQLIRYAGYKQGDGTVIGDPASVEFTEVSVTIHIHIHTYRVHKLHFVFMFCLSIQTICHDANVNGVQRRI